MQMNIQYENNKLILPQIQCDCGLQHTYPDLDIYIGQDLLALIPEYVRRRNLGRKALIVTDNVVYDPAAVKVIAFLERAGFSVDLCLLERDGILVPNETALGEIMLSLKHDTDFLIAVGSGSITDLTRYAAHVSHRPFVVVGTAPSMDGYTSVVSPLTYGNLKTHKAAGFPKIIVCDLNIMQTAPYIMFLSGFGDVIGKFMAKADWLLGNLINQEPICPVCLEIVTSAVNRCLENIKEIKQRTITGTRALIEGLILTGLTILSIGKTRAVASNEHNMAHYWEMMKLLAGETAPRHGLGVGVATVYCLKFYELFFAIDPGNLDLQKAKKANLSEEERTRVIIEKYGEKIGAAVAKDTKEDCLSIEEHERRFHALITNHALIKEKLAFLPTAEQMLQIYQDLGFPWPASAIGVDEQLLLNSLLYAKEYRTRYTVFKSANELGILSELVQQTLHELANK